MKKRQKKMLLQLAVDLSQGDKKVVKKLKKALKKPPKKTKKVGFYLSGDENDFENCFRYLVNLLEPFTTESEDKYSDEIFFQWIGKGRVLKEVPPELEQTFPFLFDESSSDENELEIQDFLEGGDYDEEYIQKVITHIRQHYASSVSALEKANENELEIQDFLEGGDYDEECIQKVITHIRQHCASGVSALEKANENELEIQDFLKRGDYDEEYIQKVITHIRQHYASGVSALEKAFEDAGQPLLSLDTGGGDTLIFINVTPEIANRWRDVLFGYTHDYDELAVRSPMWGSLWYDLKYALNLEMGHSPLPDTDIELRTLDKL